MRSDIFSRTIQVITRKTADCNLYLKEPYSFLLSRMKF